MAKAVLPALPMDRDNLSRRVGRSAASTCRLRTTEAQSEWRAVDLPSLSRSNRGIGLRQRGHKIVFVFVSKSMVICLGRKPRYQQISSHHTYSTCTACRLIRTMNDQGHGDRSSSPSPQATATCSHHRSYAFRFTWTAPVSQDKDCWRMTDTVTGRD